MFQLILLMAVSRFASAGVITAPTATITPAPLDKRLVTTAGYRSTGSSDGTTLWATVTYNQADANIVISGDQYKICRAGSNCDFFTCSGSYVKSGTSSSLCAGESTCSYDRSYTNLEDTDPMTNYWCDSTTWAGWDVYAVTTSAGVDTPEPQSTDPTTPTPNPTPNPTPTPTPTPSPTPAPKKSTPIAPIVGGVVGGIAVIGIIIVAVIFILRKKKHTPSTGANAPVPYQPAQQHQHQQGYAQPVYYPPNQQQPQMGYNPHAPMAGAFAPEKTPAATTMNANPYYANGESGPTSPVPQYSPPNPAVNELPAQRM
ncbi:hypothetical protein K458DRAFT_397385 [Lentithecium fluviatile CBS 122367]|uniref:Mid2 domain-containing protein n=1 Tax=Lentithecium fluviatile CBS 122367 TaxID=1168545 RepID=A0A6G1ICL4_9PLEO|nr:hypothetical protein K458DRAFT_397385 [Lentithecium fluviatile CBS 122367]